MSGPRTLERAAIVGLTALLVVALTGCLSTGDDTEGPTTDTGDTASSTVVTLAPLPLPPVTPTTGVIQAPPALPPEPAPAPPQTTQPARGLGDQLIYTINPGDTLFSIASQFGVSVDDLVALNNLSDPDSIRAGDQLFIPPPG